MTIPAQPSRSPSSSNFDADAERGYEIFKAAMPRMYLYNALGFAVLGVVAWFAQRSGLFADSGLFIYILTIGGWFVALFSLSLLVRLTSGPASALLYLGLSAMGGLMAALLLGSYTYGSIVLVCIKRSALRCHGNDYPLHRPKPVHPPVAARGGRHCDCHRRGH